MRWICFSALLLTARMPVLAAPDSATVRAGLAYDSNPGGLADSLSGNWVVRSYVSCGIDLFRFRKATGCLQYQGGIERRLGAGSGFHSLEGTATNGLTLQLAYQAARWVRLGLEVNVKNKAVHRMTASPGYLREEAGLSVRTRLIRKVLGHLYYRHSATDYEERFTSYRAQTVGLELQRPFRRALRLSVGVGQTELRFDRPSLHRDQTGKVSADSLGTTQEDGLSEGKAGLRLYGRILLVVDYAFQKNRSSSYGYAYQAHKLVLVATKDLPREMVGQLYGSHQWRRYQDAVAVSTEELPVDEYEHRMYIARLSKAIIKNVELDTQYAYKKASNQRERFYKQHLFAVSVDLTY